MYVIFFLSNPAGSLINSVFFEEIVLAVMLYASKYVCSWTNIAKPNPIRIDWHAHKEIKCSQNAANGLNLWNFLRDVMVHNILWLIYIFVAFTSQQSVTFGKSGWIASRGKTLNGCSPIVTMPNSLADPSPPPTQLVQFLSFSMCFDQKFLKKLIFTQN